MISYIIPLGFLGSILAMFRFGKYCRLLNRRDLPPELAERYQVRARRWLAAAGGLLGAAVVSIAAGIVLQILHVS